MDPNVIIESLFNFGSSSSSSEFEDAINERLDRVMALATQQLEELFQGKSSQPRRRPRYVDRDRESGHQQLVRDYFSEVPPSLYNDEQFRRWFRMRKPLLKCIVDALESRFIYFRQRRDATGREGLSPLQKCTAAMHMLAYDIYADQVDEYLRMGNNTARNCLKYFVEGIVYLYGDTYIRRPNTKDIQRLLHFAERRGFPGMIGSINCMHWEWKNSPTAWQGQFARGHGKPTVILETVLSYDLWIWHAFFGTTGSCNDINVLDRSPVFDDVLEGRSLSVNFTFNGHEYNMDYYLTDGIYPPWQPLYLRFDFHEGLR